MLSVLSAQHSARMLTDAMHGTSFLEFSLSRSLIGAPRDCIHSTVFQKCTEPTQEINPSPRGELICMRTRNTGSKTLPPPFCHTLAGSAILEAQCLH